MTAVHALLVTRGAGGGSPAEWSAPLTAGERAMFPRTGRIQQGALLLVKDKAASRMALVRVGGGGGDVGWTGWDGVMWSGWGRGGVGRAN